MAGCGESCDTVFCIQWERNGKISHETRSRVRYLSISHSLYTEISIIWRKYILLLYCIINNYLLVSTSNIIKVLWVRYFPIHSAQYDDCWCPDGTHLKCNLFHENVLIYSGIENTHSTVLGLLSIKLKSTLVEETAWHRLTPGCSFIDAIVLISSVSVIFQSPIKPAILPRHDCNFGPRSRDMPCC